MAIDVRYGQVNLVGVPADEPIFILRAADAASVRALRAYGELAADLGYASDAEEAILARRRFTSFRVGRGL